MGMFHGRLGTVEISTNGGSTWLNVGNIIDATLQGTKGEITTTSHSSADFEEYIQGRKDFTIDLSMRYNDTDAGQLALIANFMGDGSTLKTRFRPKGAGSTLPQRTADCFVSSCEEGSPNDDAATLNTTLRLTGPITSAAQ